MPRLRVPLRGVHIGADCVDGSEFGARVRAHAHLDQRFKGYICARSQYDLMKYLRHELAHLLTSATHESEAEEARWRAGVRAIGGRVPANRPRQR